MIFIYQGGDLCFDLCDLLRHGFIEKHPLFAPLFGKEQLSFGLYSHGGQFVQVEGQL